MCTHAGLSRQMWVAGRHPEHARERWRRGAHAVPAPGRRPGRQLRQGKLLLRQMPLQLLLRPCVMPAIEPTTSMHMHWKLQATAGGECNAMLSSLVLIAQRRMQGCLPAHSLAVQAVELGIAIRVSHSQLDPVDGAPVREAVQRLLTEPSYQVCMQSKACCGMLLAAGCHATREQSEPNAQVQRSKKVQAALAH